MSGGRVARVSPTMAPDSWTSTSTERFPLSQSRAISPCAPAGWLAASADSSSNRETPRRSASSR